MQDGIDTQAGGPRLESVADALRYFGSGMRALSRERLCVAHLDPHGGLIGVSLGYSRAADRVAVPVRRIAADALRLGTHTLVLAHNHPSGDPTPSADDCRVTARLAEVADTLGIALRDHLVFAATDCRSFRAMGLL